MLQHYSNMIPKLNQIMSTTDNNNYGGLETNRTEWTRLIDAVKRGDPDADVKLNELCTIYRNPIRRYFLGQGRRYDDADDLTQEFSKQLVRRRTFEKVDRSKGRFRSYLKVCLRHFFLSVLRKENANHNIPANIIDSVDAPDFEDTSPLPSDETADTAYDLMWAKTVLDRALVVQGIEERAKKHGTRFADFSLFLRDDPGVVYRNELMRKYNLTRTALDVAISRLRQRYLCLIIEEIKKSVVDEVSLREELNYLLRLSGHLDLLEMPPYPNDAGEK